MRANLGNQMGQYLQPLWRVLKTWCVVMLTRTPTPGSHEEADSLAKRLCNGQEDLDMQKNLGYALAPQGAMLDAYQHNFSRHSGECCMCDPKKTLKTQGGADQASDQHVQQDTHHPRHQGEEVFNLTAMRDPKRTLKRKGGADKASYLRLYSTAVRKKFVKTWFLTSCST